MLESKCSSGHGTLQQPLPLTDKRPFEISSSEALVNKLPLARISHLGGEFTSGEALATYPVPHTLFPPPAWESRSLAKVYTAKNSILRKV